MAGLRFYEDLGDVPFVYDAAGNPTRTGTLADIDTAGNVVLWDTVAEAATGMGVNYTERNGRVEGNGN